MSLANFSNLSVCWSTSENMSEIPKYSVQSVITSPPYWDLKDYEHDEQIGEEDETYDEYLSRLQDVFSECYDRLKDRGTVWIVADSFVERSDTKLLPYHIAQQAQRIGFHLQDIIVWYKPTSIAGHNPRTVVNKKEYIVCLSKQAEFDLYPEHDGHTGAEDSANGSITLRNIWRHPVKRGSLGKSDILHKAPFPISLAKRLVKISTNPDEVVLDPFLGSGTTAYAALSEDRECVGYEINRDFESAITTRLSQLNQETLSTKYTTD